MKNIYICELDDRALIKISGEDARSFLHGLVTCNVETLDIGEIVFGALLSPQGKILFDFFIVGSTKGFVVDVNKSMSMDFIKRLNFYKLRAKVEIEPMDPRTHVFAIWGDNKNQKIVADGVMAIDPRLPDMGMRAYLRRAPNDIEISTTQAWHDHRISQGMPEGGLDYVFGTSFPHEALMDQFSGVDFTKGCYIGQEVVSRMQHRGTARKRMIIIKSETALPAAGSEVLADGKSCGSITSISKNIGIAIIRLDRVANTLANKGSIVAASTPVTLELQNWVKYSWPEVA